MANAPPPPRRSKASGVPPALVFEVCGYWRKPTERRQRVNPPPTVLLCGSSSVCQNGEKWAAGWRKSGQSYGPRHLTISRSVEQNLHVRVLHSVQRRKCAIHVFPVLCFFPVARSPVRSPRPKISSSRSRRAPPSRLSSRARAHLLLCVCAVTNTTRISPSAD